MAFPASSYSKDWQINLENVDFKNFVKKISQITGETYIVDPNIKKNVTVISNEMVDEETVEQIFKSVLEVNNFILVNAGNVKMISSPAKKTNGLYTEEDEIANGTIVTKVFFLDNVDVNDIMNAVGIIVSPSGVSQASENINALIVTDFSENIKKIGEIIDRIGEENDISMTSVSLDYAWAGNIERLLKNAFAHNINRHGSSALKVLLDETNNAIILRGNSKIISEAEEFIISADQPRIGRISTKVFYLKNTQAEDMAPMLNNFLGSNYGKDSGSKMIQVQAEPSVNALIVRAEPRSMDDIKEVISKLDIKKTQVHIEAAIVEVTGNIMDDLGVQYAGGDAAIGNLGFGLTSFANTGQTILGLLQNISGDNSLVANSGLSVGYSDNRLFSLLLQALSTSSKANLLSTPSITTVNNEEARILVGQNVPFITGTYTNDSGDSNPFTTIERRDVGITLRVVPRVYDGNVVRLEVEQEVSSVQDTGLNQNAADIITNTRSISTNVIANNGEVVVLGGLIQDDVSNSESKVPFLGDIPGLGHLFKSKSTSKVKRNLLVFLRPTIINDDWQSKKLAERRYNNFEEHRKKSIKNDALNSDSRSINRVFGNENYIAKDFKKVMPTEDQGAGYCPNSSDHQKKNKAMDVSEDNKIEETLSLESYSSKKAVNYSGLPKELPFNNQVNLIDNSQNNITVINEMPWIKEASQPDSKNTDDDYDSSIMQLKNLLN